MADETVVIDTTPPPDTPTSPASGAPQPGDASRSAPPALPADWRASLPDGIKGEKSLERYKDVSALAQAYVGLEKKLGTAINKPGADATPEEVTAYRDKMGIPKDATSYDLKTPEGVTLNERDMGEWKGIFHKLNVPADAAQGLVEHFAQWQQDSVSRAGQLYADGLKTLRDEMGAVKFDRAATLVQRFVNLHGDPQIKQFFDQTRLGDHPLLFKLLIPAAELLAEDGHIDGRVEGVPTVDEAREKITGIRKELGAMDSNHPDWQRKTDEMLALYRLIERENKPVLTVG